MVKRSVIMTCAVMVAMTTAAAAQGQLDPAACKPSGSLMRLAGLSEASGLVASRATPGRFWSHNDSGTPELIAFDAKGNVTRPRVDYRRARRRLGSARDRRRAARAAVCMSPTSATTTASAATSPSTACRNLPRPKAPCRPKPWFTRPIRMARMTPRPCSPRRTARSTS